MDPDKIKKLEALMKERQACGHTNEEHLAAATIVAICESLYMPAELIRTACQILIDESHTKPERTSTSPMFMAPAGNA